MELSSTLANSIEEGLSQAEQHNASSGWNVGGDIGVEFKAVMVGVQGGASGTVSDADQRSRTRSQTDSFTASRKVAAKSRTQNKTTFRIVTENRLELTNKRILRNPNRFSPIDLHYFKVRLRLRLRLRLRQERYGARLCWAPFVADPAYGVVSRIERERDRIRRKHVPISPIRPPEPLPPPAKPPVARPSANVDVPLNFDGSQSTDLFVSVEVPDGYVWDQDAPFVARTLPFAEQGEYIAAHAGGTERYLFRMW